MIEGILEDFLAELLFLIVVSIASVIYYNRKKINELDTEVLQIKQRLFGFEEDDSDDGHVRDANRRLENIERDVKNVESDVKSIEHKVDYLVDNTQELHKDDE